MAFKVFHGNNNLCPGIGKKKNNSVKVCNIVRVMRDVYDRSVSVRAPTTLQPLFPSTFGQIRRVNFLFYIHPCLVRVREEFQSSVRQANDPT